MKIYIRATGNISPQKTFGHQFLTESLEHTGDRLTCVEPDYKDIIDVKLIRRMSRIIKMGVASAMECLQESGIAVPDAITTGTAYGCLEDTAVFLTKMVEQNEELLTPTAFIQSTHNTIGAQIALMLQCHNYNNTFVHRGFSFESALLDGMMLLSEKEANNVLVGGVDEITNVSHSILKRMGLYKRENVSNLDLFIAKPKGTIAGEGAAFFLLTNESSANDYAVLDGIHTFYKPVTIAETEQQILSFLSAQLISINDVDLIIAGRNGDLKNDKIYDQLQASIFNNDNIVNYKHLCGEYPTSTAFALWMASNIIKTATIPTIISKRASKNKLKKVLIYNHYQNINHSLMLLSAC
ncbi:MAG TPA: beta-ketoacyl synthase chain length factor [Ferruginibacter sp.]|nr:beta-ketoacyl synthase chain length factor [Ferruginibacter sp.]